MNLADYVILVLVALTAVHGYRRGLIVGAASIVGFVGGAVIGARLGPSLLNQGVQSPYAPWFGLAGAVILAAAMGSIFQVVAGRLRRFVWLPGLRTVDRLLGALLMGCVGVGIAWIVAAAALQSQAALKLPASLRRELTRSTVLHHLDRVLPPSGPILNALGRVDPLAGVTGVVAAVRAPNPAIITAVGVQSARRSIVRVLGHACGLGIEGSGWVAGPGLVVTAAHVVAGESDTTVQLIGVGRALGARVLVFDPHNDIAVLSVAGLSVPSLTLACKPASGTAGAILGFPLDGGLSVKPGRLGRTSVILTENAYGNPALRDVTALRGTVRPGNSGGPIVDGGGHVLGTVFAKLSGRPADSQDVALAVPDGIVANDLIRARAAHGSVATGACAP
ncbi:MAG: MarP family serine protease [Solirubrobacteraceae bacterium]